MVRFVSLVGWILLGAATVWSAPPRANPEGQLPDDVRLAPPKDLNGYFPFTPSETKEAWEARAQFVRRQTLVALGLWPMPPATPANAVVHGLIDQPDYTVEKAYFESYPGHFVTGSLYRPKGKSGPLPIVLCPHGHWPNGRFTDQGEAATKRQIAEGAERFEDGGRSPLQSRCVQLARMGCLVFHYDMIGYADSVQIPFDVAHRYGKPRPHMETAENWGLFTPQAELWLQNILGLQTYNSIRALDWLLTLPGVDPTRIAVTGASGGGTQTFLLAAVDPRISVQFPAVMVSTAMQGGCTCENCSLLRVGTGNIELAALFAPKPLGMTAANDWTREIMTKGLPELQAHYRLLGAPDNVMAKALVHFPHNYNSPSRHVMYAWFNKHLRLGLAEPIIEGPYTRLTAEQLTVWDDAHPKPAGGEDYERSLCRTMTTQTQQQLESLQKADAGEYAKILRGGWEALIGRTLSAKGEVEWKKRGEISRDTYEEFFGVVRHPGRGEEVPVIFLHPNEWKGPVTLWLDPQGKAGLFTTGGEPRPEVKRLIEQGSTVVGLDLFGQGEFLAADQPALANRKVKTEREFAGFTYGYNHPLFAQRVHDVLTVLSLIKHHREAPEHIRVVGAAGAGHWAAAAAFIAGDMVERVVVEPAGFRFANLTDFAHPDFLPGAVKYGDLPTLLKLLPPSALVELGPQRSLKQAVDQLAP